MACDDSVKGPWRDPIVEEIHRLREEHAARFNYDIRAMAEDMRMRQEVGAHKVVTFARDRHEIANKSIG